MKKRIALLALLLCGATFAAQSQEFKPFRVDAGLGYGLPFTENLNGGLVFYAEPKYEVTDRIAVGLRWEGSLFGGAREGVSISISSAYMATGDYYFSNNTFRPFVGLGLGMHSFGTATTNNPNDVMLGGDGGTNFGCLVRAGFDVSHFRLAASYNYAGKQGENTHHYVALTVGFYIGGGKN